MPKIILRIILIWEIHVYQLKKKQNRANKRVIRIQLFPCLICIIRTRFHRTTKRLSHHLYDHRKVVIVCFTQTLKSFDN
jgi:hypothetical protein